MSEFKLTNEQIDQFKADGYLMLPRLFDDEEMDLLRKIGRADTRLASEARDRLDAAGGKSRLALRNDLGDDIYSAFVRSHRIASLM